uniref:NADH-ubiquinone oxidoreductase chain 3 n=1 Tax=Rhinebothrium sp. 1 TaxID=108307 RepID=A0A8K1W688_9CEST|nr:NADH dehydrogenase subunit 3 [Rhinebothrium sp. 1]UFQ88643.1 NADH dehydrogenase subunit 3 [Rhinebothrium sp. 1]UFQ88691.1 NADH dehydrogenase subunit 3 [Rhinebothrium sp. 1]
MFVVFYGLLIFSVLLFLITFFTSGIFNKLGVLSGAWASPYECGFVSSSLSFNCFSFTYFSLLVFFVVFDLEISLLLNLPEQGVLYNNFFYYFFFLILLTTGFIVEVLLGYVRWGY